MTLSTRILIAGYGVAPVMAILRLLADGYRPADIGLLTHDDSRNQFLIQYAATHGIETQTFSVKSESCYAWIRARRFQALHSLHFRHIIPARVLDIFEGRAMNLHGGVLPAYRGCWSTSWALINGDPVGYTYHRLTPQIDDGDILKAFQCEPLPHETAYSLFHDLLRLSLSDYDAVRTLLDSDAPGTPQTGESGYYSRAVPYGGYIQPGWTDEQVDRFIRALYFPPHKGALLRLPDGSEQEILTMKDYYACQMS